MRTDDIRSGGLVTAKATDTLVICAARMLEYRVGCLPVLDGRGAVGIVTRRDLMEAAAAALEQETLFESHEPRFDPAAPTAF